MIRNTGCRWASASNADTPSFGTAFHALRTDGLSLAVRCNRMATSARLGSVISSTLILSARWPHLKRASPASLMLATQLVSPKIDTSQRCASYSTTTTGTVRVIPVLCPRVSNRYAGPRRTPPAKQSREDRGDPQHSSRHGPGLLVHAAPSYSGALTWGSGETVTRSV
jgi:hypothetical protein